ncbi:ribonuclease PH [Kiritimatiella glycovorans]|uniref:Ribonuclease PH n=1 Tax=Kiritimatiella glycovorans TaxID=1307763 RepID=A0A0G3EED2_9BACT|nr:ribonuclease PH [Kiritimatiella glycovorans]AKJ64688.1 Ribonuclease PH [Kiritimatiella glycovorans]
MKGFEELDKDELELPPYEREDGRAADELRTVAIEPGFIRSARGSVLIAMGNTRVICTASVDESVPGWMRAQNVPGGWLTAEYGMLPAATADRNRREVSAGKPGGRTMEIQRLIGRALRAVVDLEKLGRRQIYLDCDVIQADGGTRTASITGAYVALRLAVNHMRNTGLIKENPISEPLAAVSVGVVEKTPLLDLCYVEDSAAEVDMNVVMTASGKFIELQGTAEERPFSRDQLDAMLGLAEKGIGELLELQESVISASG